MARRRICAVAVIALVVVASTLAQVQAYRRLLPVDQAATQPDFFTFRAQLLTAVARHDAAALMAVVHPNIKCDFGGGEGKAFFEEYWKPSAPGSEVWAELAAVLALGGTFSTPDTFVAPYVFSRWPQGLDAFEHVAVVGDRVRIRTAPRPDAEAAAVSSFEILPLARQSGDAPEEWTAVTIAGRKIGYVASRFVRSPIGYRAYFSREDGRWQMLMFIAGD
jgi:hypothetical protein